MLTRRTLLTYSIAATAIFATRPWAAAWAQPAGDATGFVVQLGNALVGIVTDRDIVVKAVASGHGPETTLNECMTVNPDSVPKDIPIEHALHVMNTRQIRRLPVVEYGRLIGMISLGDIAKSQTPAAETLKTLEIVSAGGSEVRSGTGLPES